MATAAEIQTAYKAIYRTDLNATVAQAIASTGITLDAYIAQEVPKVATTTQAAVAITAFVTGVTPTSTQLDALKVAADAQVASYTKMGVANPSLAAYEAFGRGLATDTTTTATFSTKYGALSTSDFITTVYAQVYGTTPSAGAAANLTAQITYFTNLYTANNVPNAALAAKGAVLGQIVGYAFVTDASAQSTLDNQVATFLTAAANGTTTGFAAALPPAAGSGNAGAILTLTGTAAADVVDPSQTTLSLKSTAGDDTIRALTGVALDSSDVINGGAGVDSIVANTVASAAVTIAPALTSVEKVFLAGQAGTIFSGSAASGLQEVWNDGSNVASTLTISNVGTSVTAGVKGGLAAATTVNFSAVTGTNDTAKIALDGVAANAVTVNGIENLQVAVAGAPTAATTTTITDTELKTLSFSNVGASTAGTNVTLAAGSIVNLTTIDASASKGAVTLGVIAGTTNAITATGGAGNDTFDFTGSTKVITINGGAGNDLLKGGGAADIISGGEGNDVITGLVGGDTITLGAGNDVVVYTAVADSTAATITGTVTFDTITDFKTAGADIIDTGAFSGGNTFTVGANAIAAQNAVSALAASATLTDALNAAVGAGKIDLNQTGFFAFKGDTYVVVNENAAGFVAADDLVVKLTGVVNLVAADFVL